MANGKEIKLGQEVKDRVTGFKGIAVARVIHLNGCDRISVQPQSKKLDEIKDAKMFDEPDLDIIGNGILKNVDPKGKPEVKPKKTGGPHSHDMEFR